MASPKSLNQRNEADTLIDTVVEKLKGLGYLDDKAFTSWWVEQRIRFKPRGKILLASELYTKGIGRNLIETELAKYSSEDEVSWAQQFIEKKLPSYEKLEPRKRKQKLSAHLARRGFSWEVIKRIEASLFKPLSF